MPAPPKKKKKKKVALPLGKDASRTVSCLRGIPLHRASGKSRIVGFSRTRENAKPGVIADSAPKRARAGAGSKSRKVAESDSSGDGGFDDSLVPPEGWYGAHPRHALWFAETFGHSETNVEVEAEVCTEHGTVTGVGRILRFVKNNKGKYRYAEVRWRPGGAGALKKWNSRLSTGSRRSPLFHFCGDRECSTRHSTRPLFHVLRWRLLESGPEKGEPHGNTDAPLLDGGDGPGGSADAGGLANLGGRKSDTELKELLADTRRRFESEQRRRERTPGRFDDAGLDEPLVDADHTPLAGLRPDGGPAPRSKAPDFGALLRARAASFVPSAGTGQLGIDVVTPRAPLALDALEAVVDPLRARDPLYAGFHAGSARGMVGPQELARSQPGALLGQALQQMQTYDSARSDPTEMTRGSFQRYLQTILFARHTEASMGMRNARELKTLAKTLDHILEGNVPSAADTLVQRWKAVETAVSEGSWSLARHQELLPHQDVGLTGDPERAVLARTELERARLEEVTKRASDRGGSRGAQGHGRGG